MKFSRVGFFLSIFGALLFIFAANFTSLLNEDNIDNLLEDTGAYNRLGGDAEAINHQIIGFITSEGDVLPEITERERSHLADVRDKIKGVSFFKYFGLALFLFGMYLYMVKGKVKCDDGKKLYVFLFWLGGIGVGIVLISSLLLWVFDSAFEVFHIVLFDDNWKFPSTSTLIMLYNQEFFFKFFKGYIISLFTNFSVFFLIGAVVYYINNRTKRKL